MIRWPHAPRDPFAVRLATVYAAFFLFNGIQMPYLPAWLAGRGLDAREIGIVLAVPMLVRILAVPLATRLIDRHAEDTMLETAICKLFCSEGSWQVIDDAVQIWGGEGYMRENALERMLRDARINRIVEGASEVMTAFIALAGMKGVGEGLESAVRSARHPVGNFGCTSPISD